MTEVHNFGQLKDGDVVRVSLDGLYKTRYTDLGYLYLDSVEGYDSWTFEPDEGEGWSIEVIGHDSSSSDTN